MFLFKNSIMSTFVAFRGLQSVAFMNSCNLVPRAMPVRGLGWHWGTGGKFAVAGQQIAGASENFVLNY
jgi:hypothetical protein